MKKKIFKPVKRATAHNVDRIYRIYRITLSNMKLGFA